MKKIIKFCFKCLRKCINFVINPPENVARFTVKVIGHGLEASADFEKQRQQEIEEQSKEYLDDWIRIHRKV